MKDPKIYNVRKHVLDEDSLIKLIDQFKTDKNQCPYLFMSRETIVELNYLNLFTDKIIITYKGCRIFEDPTRQYGEVELR